MREASSKIVSRDVLQSKLAEHRRRREHIVFANGCFDALHVGHIRYLEGARREGDILVVQGTTRPFSGAWRLRSPWESLPEDYGRAILIRREHGSLAGPVVLLLGNGNDTERILRVSFAMTEPDDAVVILVREEESSRLERVRQITESLESARRRKVRLEASPTEPAIR